MCWPAHVSAMCNCMWGQVRTYRSQKMALGSSQMMGFQLVGSCLVKMMGSHSSPLKGQKVLCIAESSLQLSKPCSDHVKKIVLMLFVLIANTSELFCVLHRRRCSHRLQNTLLNTERPVDIFFHACFETLCSYCSNSASCTP